jgi:Mrp family chromosome partitioning ATPase
MPQLVASDFDYIVFDMPPIGPTSPTLTMAGFMDKVLLVLDGNHTTREHLSWAYSELEKAKADVSCVFNKARSHAPQWVQGAV